MKQWILRWLGLAPREESKYAIAQTVGVEVMASPYIPGIDPYDRLLHHPIRESSAIIEVRVKNALRINVLAVNSGYAIAVNGEVYVGSTVEDCVKHIVTALVTQGLEK